MQVRFARWGNSLAVRIPKPATDAMGVREDDTAELTVSADGAMTLAPKRRSRTLPKFDLEKLLDQITEENRHPEVSTGRAVGNEFS